MRSNRLRLALRVAFVMLAAPAGAAVPNVVADIAPVHSLVAQVMQGVGTPTLLLPPGVSPHEANLRPSQASALAHADLVFRVGSELSPALDHPLTSLAGQARLVSLLDAPATTRLAFRSGIAFDDHDHGDGDEHEHEHEHGGEGMIDPHAWLDPENGRAWLAVIADALAQADPENATTYAANADAGRAEIAALEAEIATRLAPMEGTPFLLAHDATQYFEARFGLSAATAISLADGASPGPARLAAIHELAAEKGITCVFAEPQTDPRRVQTVADRDALRIITLDPLGVDLPPGPTLYPELLRGLAAAFSSCAP